MKKISFKKSFLLIALMFSFTLVLVACGQKTNAELVTEALTTVEVGFTGSETKEAVMSKVTLPSKAGKVTVTWTSSDPAVISAAGVVVRATQTKEVTLTATLTLGEAKEVKTFKLTVVAADDKVAPAFMGLVDGKLPAIEHLATQTVDLMEGVTARDNKDNYDVTLTLDQKDYDKAVSGVYTITYTATDKSENSISVDRVITVLKTLDTTVNAAVIGDDWVPYVYNDATAFKAGEDGAAFRFIDELHVMSKAFYSEQLLEHAADYPTNDGIPVFPYGALVITDSEYNIIQVRLQTGVFLQMDVADGVTTFTHTDVSWNNGGGGNTFLGVEALIPEGGFVMFSSSIAPQKTRIFLASNLFYSGYTGGAMTKDVQDVFELSTIDLQVIEDYRVLIEMPDAIETPVIELNRHTLSWEKVTNALNYQLFVDGVAFGEPMTTTSIDLSSLELALSTDDGYSITVVANTTDEFKYSTSEVSNSIMYKKIEIITLDAPVIAIDSENANLLTWDAVVGTDRYEVYLKMGAITQLVGTTSELSFDVSGVTGFNGVNGFYVRGIGLATHSDSVASNILLVDQTETTTMSFDGMLTEVVVTNATDYFNRRNLTDGSKLGAFIYLITDIKAVESWTGIYTEAFSTVVLLDSQYQAKFVRTVLGTATYTKANGWTADAIGNGTQLVGLGEHINDGDMLLIGKNGLNVTVTDGEATHVVGGRDFPAYHFAKAWDTFPLAPVAPNGWRAPMTEFKDASTTVVTVVVE